MNKLAIMTSITAIILIFQANVIAQHGVQVDFDEATRYLLENDAYSALKVYKKIEDEGYKSPELYLNMAISATRIDSLGLAKYYFLKTIKYWPGNADFIQKAEEGLTYLETQFSRQSAILPKLPWNKAIDWLITKPTPTGVFWFGYIMVLLTCILLMARWFNFINFKGQRDIIIVLAILSVLIISLAYYTDYIEQRYDEAVIINNETKVLQQPTDNGIMESFAYEGYTLTIDHKISQDNTDWYYVRLSNGQAGWIKKSEIKIL